MSVPQIDFGLVELQLQTGNLHACWWFSLWCENVIFSIHIEVVQVRDLQCEMSDVGSSNVE